jgi:hypothetical protein
MPSSKRQEQEMRARIFNLLSVEEMMEIIKTTKVKDIAKKYKLSLSSVYRLVDRKVSKQLLEGIRNPRSKERARNQPFSKDENDYGYGHWMNGQERVARKTVVNELEYINPLKHLL